jgi:CBS domain containing-hemolysin-like protein
VTVGFVLATIAQMVVGELAPKNLAIARPEPVARALAPSTWAFMRGASPLIRFFDGSANRLLRAVGITPAEELHGGVSVEELDLIVDESAERGKLSHRQAALLTRALDFGELRAALAMVPWNRVVTVPDTATGEDLRAVIASGHSRFPVVTGEGVVTAVVHAKDLLGIPARGLAGASTAELARPALVVPESAGLRAVLGQLRGGATEMAIVVDEYGAPAGAITLEDLVEELVGDITDEHDPDLPGAEMDKTGAWLVPGSWRLDEIERHTGVVLPQGDYGTVAGLVLARLQRLAAPGDHVVVAGVTIEVVSVEGWAITRVRLRVTTGDRDDYSGVRPDER